MVTGSRGIHIVVPIKRNHTFDFVRNFLRDLIQPLVDKNKKLFTLEVRKEKRKKRVFIDIMRNAFGQTAVAPYGVRPKKGAPVAVPISWKEVQSSSLKPDKYTIKNIFKHLKSTKDPWKGMLRHSSKIGK